MKKDKEWLRNKVNELEHETSQYMPHNEMVEIDTVLDLIEQCFKPEEVYVVKFNSIDYYPLVDEVGYFKYFVTDKDNEFEIKPNGETVLDFKKVHKFKEKEKAEAVALLINGTVEKVEVTE